MLTKTESLSKSYSGIGYKRGNVWCFTGFFLAIVAGLGARARFGKMQIRTYHWHISYNQGKKYMGIGRI